MKKFPVLLSTGTAFASASCASHSHAAGECCGTCGGDSKTCEAGCTCEKCKAE